MSVPLVINGVTFNYPVQFDTNWGPTLTAWSTAVTNGMLQKAGGSFTLTSEVDLGNSFGIRTKYIKSEESNVSSTGVIRLSTQSLGIGFRNTLNSADLILTTNASNMLTFNGVILGPPTALLDGHIYVGNSMNQPADVAMSGDVTIIDTGVTTISNGAITNAKVNAAAAIALSKLAAVSAFQWVTGTSGGVLNGTSVTANRAVASDSNGLPVASSTTDTELGYVHGVTSSIQTQINAIAGGATVPTGSLFDFAGTVAPSGYLVCDGSAISRTTFSTLFTAIGTTWGSGDGSTTFNIPSLSRRTSVGSGGSGSGTLGNAVGNTGGTETVTPTDSGHTHAIPHKHSNTSGVQSTTGFTIISDTGPANGVTSITADIGEFGVSRAAAQTVNMVNTGNTLTPNSSSGTANITATNIIQPSAVVLKIIKT